MAERQKPVLSSTRQHAFSKNRAWSWAFWACAVGVLVLSLAPVSTPMPSTGWDKSNHLLAFATLTVLANGAWPGRSWLLLTCLLSYGALIEVLQSLTPDRRAEWADLGADAFGMLVGIVLFRLGNVLAQRKKAR